MAKRSYRSAKPQTHRRALSTDIDRKAFWRHRLRFAFVALVLFSALVGLIWRMVNLNITKQAFLQAQGDARILREIDIPAYRGMITDRHGKPLAISTPIDSIWVNPQVFSPSQTQLHQLASLLHRSTRSLRIQVTNKQHGREFTYLKRHVNPTVVKQVKAMKLHGLHFQREYKRYYPEGGITAHVLGLTNIDDKGQEGIELMFNDWLQGVPGRKKVIKDRLGNVVSVLNTTRKPDAGKDLKLSIDRRIQFLAYQNLKAAIKKNKAKSGSVVVLDVATGEVLAMVNLPTYNPNLRRQRHDSRYRNRAVTDVFEPGSTIKTFSVANALRSGRYTPDTIIDTSPGWMMLNGNRVADEHNNEKLSVTEILQKSSNMGVTKMMLSLSPNNLWQLLRDSGFGQTTGSGFPGESSGMLENHAIWQPFTVATLSFGYGLSVTALQLARAYAMLAAAGELKPISFLKTDQISVTGKHVLSKQIAQKIRTMMEYVTQRGGTALRARVPGYRVAGKTGTVRIVGPNGYEKHHHIGLFVGMAPVDAPRLVTVVVINDPRGKYYYGGLVAAPVFSQVMRGALRLIDGLPKTHILKQHQSLHHQAG